MARLLFLLMLNPNIPLLREFVVKYHGTGSIQTQPLLPPSKQQKATSGDGDGNGLLRALFVSRALTVSASPGKRRVPSPALTAAAGLVAGSMAGSRLRRLPASSSAATKLPAIQDSASTKARAERDSDGDGARMLWLE